MVKAFREHWGAAVFGPDGGFDRKKIAQIVFDDEQELSWLNSVIHPLIREKAEEIIGLRADGQIIFAVPLLFEAGWEPLFDRVICVWTDREVQINRLAERNWSRAQIMRRIESQMPNEEKMERADMVIINTGDKSLLLEQCKLINKQLILKRQL